MTPRPDGGPSATPRRTRHRTTRDSIAQRLPALVTLLVLVALAIAAVPLISATLDTDDDLHAAEEQGSADGGTGRGTNSGETADATRGVKPAATPSDAPSRAVLSVDASLGAAGFASSSGNIRCWADTDGLTCTQQTINYAPPDAMCESKAVAAAVRITPAGVAWPCVEAELAKEVTLDYDTDWVYGDYVCFIARGVGVTCTNAVGAGFTMGIDSGIALIAS